MRLPSTRAMAWIAQSIWPCLAFMPAVADFSPAYAVTLLEDNTNVVAVSDLTGFATDGNDMAFSLQVTAVFLDGTSETITWAATGPDSGGIVFTSWSLREAGDTFLGAGFDDEGLWVTSVEPGVFVDRLVLTGATSKNPAGQTQGVVFDRTGRAFSFGTDKSYRGRDFEVAFTVTSTGAAPGFDDFVVTYSNPVDVVADGPGVVGDLFGQLTIDPILRSGQPGYFYAANQLGFRVDTDTVGLFDVKSKDGRLETIPEPSSLALLGAAGVMGAWQRRFCGGTTLLGVKGARRSARPFRAKKAPADLTQGCEAYSSGSNRLNHVQSKT